MRLLLSLLFFVSGAACCQNLEALLMNSKEIEANRYEGVISGSAYFFEDFVRGNIISNSAETFEKMLLNYNAETSEFEIIQDGKTIQLYKPRYLRVEIYPEDNPDLQLEFPVIFQRGFHMNWLDKFGQVLYDGNSIKLIKDYTVEISINEVQDVGKTIQNKRFVDLQEYFFLVEGELISIKLKRKRILKELSNKDGLESYIKENDLDVESESGLRKLLEYYETLK